MPMVADSPFGILDATLTENALVVPWGRVHRARPRVSLTCRACQKALHAKISKCGLRFFAHDAVNKMCPLTGETLQHRLLKSALAGAVRRCGWHAELEARASDGKWSVVGKFSVVGAADQQAVHAGCALVHAIKPSHTSGFPWHQARRP